MTPQYAMDLAYLVIITAAKISAPFLITAIVVGVIINVIQTVTSIRDQSVTFVPKVAAAALVTGLSLPWVIEQILGFFNHVFQMMGAVNS